MAGAFAFCKSPVPSKPPLSKTSTRTESLAMSALLSQQARSGSCQLTMFLYAKVHLQRTGTACGSTIAHLSTVGVRIGKVSAQ